MEIFFFFYFNFCRYEDAEALIPFMSVPLSGQEGHPTSFQENGLKRRRQMRKEEEEEEEGWGGREVQVDVVKAGVKKTKNIISLGFPVTSCSPLWS